MIVKNLLTGLLLLIVSKSFAQETVVQISDKSLNVKGKIVNNKKQGEWIWHYQDGVPETKVNFLNDKLNGDFIFFSETGTILLKGIYNNNIIQSYYPIDYPQQNVIGFENRMSIKIMHFEETYLASGQIKSVLDEAKGINIIYSLDGIETKRLIYEKVQDKKQMYHRLFENGGGSIRIIDGLIGELLQYEKGNLISRNIYCGIAATNTIKIEKIEYYNNGKIKSKKTLVKGVIVDEVLEYYESGNLKAMMFKNSDPVPFDDNSLSQPYLDIYSDSGAVSIRKGEDGKIYEKIVVKKVGNDIHKTFYDYYKNGIVRVIENDINSDIDGVMIHYNDKGELICKGVYKKSKPYNGEFLENTGATYKIVNGILIK